MKCARKSHFDIWRDSGTNFFTKHVYDDLDNFDDCEEFDEDGQALPVESDAPAGWYCPSCGSYALTRYTFEGTSRIECDDCGDSDFGRGGQPI
jgi:predicted RNA-binding Zn-ribbon protein involved in translation (DUF1610 family)